jgi:hypothetical protein
MNGRWIEPASTTTLLSQVFQPPAFVIILPAPEQADSHHQYTILQCD